MLHIYYNIIFNDIAVAVVQLIVFLLTHIVVYTDSRWITTPGDESCIIFQQEILTSGLRASRFALGRIAIPLHPFFLFRTIPDTMHDKQFFKFSHTPTFYLNNLTHLSLVELFRFCVSTIPY